jgi:hypothetical protein
MQGALIQRSTWIDDMTRKLVTIIGIPISLVIMMAGCSTVPLGVETPKGTRPGDVFGRMEILGFSSKLTRTLNQKNQGNQPLLFIEHATINVPVGTEFIVPSIKGWWLSYGSLEPADFGDGRVSWITTDHNFGLATVNVNVLDIDAPDMSATPPTQTAKIDIEMRLCDVDHEDDWFGFVSYDLLFLAKQKVKLDPTKIPPQ